MNPWLVYTDALRLPTYFTSLMVGFALAAGLLRRESIRRGMDPKLAIDAAFWVLPAALIGARLTHVVVEAPAFYAENPLLILSPNGGWVFYGGFAGALLAGASFARHKGVDLWALTDVFAVATSFGLIFGRIGCLGGGCCYGRPADWPLGVDVPWSVRYHLRGQLPEELLAVPLHPAPLYEATFCLLLFVGLARLSERQRPDQRTLPAGSVLLAFVGAYGLGRSVIEAFRADAVRGMWLGGWLSTSQIIGITTAVLAFALLAWRRRAAAAAPTA